MLNPFAFYDNLSIASKLQENLGNFVNSELHLFSYLACLLSLYKNNPVSDWGYHFAGTKYSAPFSTSIEDAVEFQIKIGLFREYDQYLQITQTGILEYTRLAQLAQNRKKEPFIHGACSSVLAMSVNVLRNALSEEPGLKAATELVSPRLLLDETNPSLVLVYDQFQTLSNTIGVNLENLMVPAVLWLTYLSNTEDQLQNGAKNG